MFGVSGGCLMGDSGLLECCHGSARFPANFLVMVAQKGSSPKGSKESGPLASSHGTARFPASFRSDRVPRVLESILVDNRGILEAPFSIVVEVNLHTV